jgi:hypothetical protein
MYVVCTSVLYSMERIPYALLHTNTEKNEKRDAAAVIGKHASSSEVLLTRRNLILDGPHQQLRCATHTSLSGIQIGRRRAADCPGRCWFASTRRHTADVGTHVRCTAAQTMRHLDSQRGRQVEKAGILSSLSSPYPDYSCILRPDFCYASVWRDSSRGESLHAAT